MVHVDQQHQVDLALGQLRIVLRAQHRRHVRDALAAGEFLRDPQHLRLNVVAQHAAFRADHRGHAAGVVARAATDVDDQHPFLDRQSGHQRVGVLLLDARGALQPAGAPEGHHVGDLPALVDTRVVGGLSRRRGEPERQRGHHRRGDGRRPPEGSVQGSSQRASHSSTSSCHCTLFAGLSTQWFSSGK